MMDKITYTELYDFLKRVDNGFHTPISKSVGLDQYATKVIGSAHIEYVKRGGKIVGVCICYCNNLDTGVAYISLLGVDKEYRGQKLAKELVLKTISYARGKGFMSIGVHSVNPIAIHLYESIGFTTTDVSGKKYLTFTLKD